MTSSRDYTIIYITIKSTTRFMNDYDASSVWDYEISAHDLDENYSYSMQDSYDLDEEYARDSYDYTELAYMHYA